MNDRITDPDCIFCKIIAGQIPCHKLYEDDRVLAFLDIGPLSEGHCLVIPRDHHVTLDTMPEQLAAHCMRIVARLGKAVVAALADVTDWNVLQNNGPLSGQVVPHVHFHIIPRKADDGLGFRWPAGKLTDEQAARLTADIAAQLG